MDLRFKKFSGGSIPDLITYVQEYITKFPEVEVMIGTDSQNHNSYTSYCTIVAMYKPGQGGHCIYRKWRTNKVTVRSVRLLAEVWASIETANLLRGAGILIKYLDIDINPNPRFKSYEVYASAKGMVEGLGYECRCKTFLPLVTSMADWVVKGG